MVFRWMLALPVALCLSNSLHAQLPSQRFSPLNYLGRYHGFGYSDGYHSCKDARCSTHPWTKTWDGMSSFYGSPTPPPTRRLIYSPPVHVAPYSQSNAYALPSFSSSPEPQVFSTPNTYVPTPATPNASSSTLQISPAVPAAPPSSGVPSLYEPIEAAPLKNNGSPSDRGNMDLPAPASEPERIPASPSAQYRRTPPGTHSLIHQSMFRK